jgi:hypothetical protein
MAEFEVKPYRIENTELAYVEVTDRKDAEALVTAIIFGHGVTAWVQPWPEHSDGPRWLVAVPRDRRGTLNVEATRVLG